MEWCKDWIEYKGEGECPPEVVDLPCMVMVYGEECDEAGKTKGREWFWRKQITHYKIPQSDYDRIYGGSADDKSTSDGSSASYYELPEGASELQDLISHRNMNAQDGEIFRAIYRKGRASHSDELRDAKKVLFYAQAEVKRLEALNK